MDNVTGLADINTFSFDLLGLPLDKIEIALSTPNCCSASSKPCVDPGNKELPDSAENLMFAVLEDEFGNLNVEEIEVFDGLSAFDIRNQFGSLSA